METATTQSFQPRTFSIKLWPPSQATRVMLVERIAKNLSTESIFSRKYGLLTKEEATLDAKEIEEAGFAAANEHYEREPDGDGSSAVQLYAKETSKLMLQILKRGPKPKKAVVGEEPAIPLQKVFDISGGKRAFLDAQEAEELLKPLAEEGNAYTRICFSNRSFGLDAAHVAGPVLESLKGRGPGCDEGLFCRLGGYRLRYLNLSDNALGEKGVRAFASLLSSQGDLEELYLMNDGISEEAARAVAELVPSTEKLKVLHFHNNMTGDEGAVAISEILRRSPVLEDFRCSSTRVDSEGGIALAEALETCTRLRKFDLRDNMFGVDAGKALSQTLEKLPAITELYLSYLNLEDEGAVAVCKALEGSNLPLTVLEMAGNDITAAAVPVLCSCISSKQSIVKLNLSENEIKDGGAVLIGKALESGHPQLRELDMSSNSIGRAGARCLARAVAASNKLEFSLLNINGNAISEEGIDEVREILKSGKNSVSVLGPLDENDAEGEGEEEEAEEGGDEGELESKLHSSMLNSELNLLLHF
ncbi:unnamed protein product [Spirodela intermedia]|uniref:WPP domain-containing protein n=1 Tax=Spirodela intermedia TaxID=51605 RepID=A0A7I8JAB0_SPIIN|nr:unnamed protein product [Spirodela intermedia]CAA6667156.1 unnamed protein product [Spirodela intermedia]